MADSPFNEKEGNWRYDPEIIGPNVAKGVRTGVTLIADPRGEQQASGSSNEIGEAKPVSVSATQPAPIGPNHYFPHTDDIRLLARMMFTEAAGEESAYSGIGWSALNLVRTPDYSHNRSLREVISAPHQFQGIGLGSPSLWAKSASPSLMAPDNKAAYNQAVKIAKGILNGQIADPTDGATTFYSGQDPGGLSAQIRSGALTYTGYKRGDFSFLRQTNLP